MANQKVTVSLPVALLNYTDRYKENYGLNRSEVLVLALKALQDKELAEGYDALAKEMVQMDDPWIDSGLEETLKYNQ